MTAPLGRLLICANFPDPLPDWRSPPRPSGQPCRRRPPDAPAFGGDGEEARSLRELDPDQLSLQMGQVKKGQPSLEASGMSAASVSCLPEQGVFQLARLATVPGTEGTPAERSSPSPGSSPSSSTPRRDCGREAATPVVRSNEQVACRGAQLKNKCSVPRLAFRSPQCNHNAKVLSLVWM